MRRERKGHHNSEERTLAECVPHNAPIWEFEPINNDHNYTRCDWLPRLLSDCLSVFRLDPCVFAGMTARWLAKGKGESATGSGGWNASRNRRDPDVQLNHHTTNESHIDPHTHFEFWANALQKIGVENDHAQTIGHLSFVLSSKAAQTPIIDNNLVFAESGYGLWCEEVDNQSLVKSADLSFVFAHANQATLIRFSILSL